MAPDNTPERLAHLPEAVLTAIHAACDGDWRRVTVDADGGFTVHNAPQFRRVELTPEGDTARRLGIAPAPVRRPRRPSGVVAAAAAPTATTARPTPAAQAAPAPAVAHLPPAARPAPSPVPAPAPPAVVFTPPAPAPAAVTAPSPRPVDPPEEAADEPDDGDVPRHPRYLRARLRALGASVGPPGDDGRAAVFVGQTQVGSVTLVDYRSKQAAREWRDLLARVRTSVAE
jgi:hypothetical protein